jgi:hypothetical protein
VLELEKRGYSFSEISKLVETNDAHITQLNSYYDNTSETFFVTLKINKFEISDIVPPSSVMIIRLNIILEKSSMKMNYALTMTI